MFDVMGIINKCEGRENGVGDSGISWGGQLWGGMGGQNFG